MITDPELIRNLASGMAGGIIGGFLLWLLLLALGRSVMRLRVFLALGVFVGAVAPLTAFQVGH